MAFHPILIAAAVSSARAYYSHICHYEIALIPACGVAEVAAEEDLLAKLFAVVSGLRGPSIRAYIYALDHLPAAASWFCMPIPSIPSVVHCPSRLRAYMVI